MNIFKKFFPAIFPLAAAMAVSEGDPMQPVSLKNENEKTVNIARPEGNWLILYFYPKDDTPGCTAQAKEFSRLKGEFAKEGAEIYGVNTDSPESHRRFIKKHDISVSLLSDPKGIVAKQFGVNVTMGMCSRDTVVVDSQGRIFKIFRGVNPKANPTEILSLLREK